MEQIGPNHEGERGDAQYHPGRRRGGRGWPRAVQIDAAPLGTLFYDLSPEQGGGPGLYVVRTPLAALGRG